MKKEYYLYLLLSSTMLGVPVVYAACVPTPDCEELGYTATECPEGGVKCPWDTTKLFCGPSCNLTTTKADCDANCLEVGTSSCFKNGTMYYGGCGVSKCTTGQSCVSGTCTCDSVYKYACSGTGYAGGVGTACGGKYTACTCSSPYTWSSGACSCPTTYKYACTGTGYSGGSGTACGGKYQSCTCISPYTWSSGACSCPTTYKYTCSGTGYSGGSGTACGGLYSACTCASGYEWKNGACEKSCDETCSVGNILYSDYTCSSCNVSGKTPIGVISYASGSTKLAINLVRTQLEWGGRGTDISGLTNITSESQAKNDFSGKSNTSKIVSVLGSSSTSYAAGYCYNYTTAGTSKGDWYLPAQGELYATVWTNKTAVNSGLSAAGGTVIPNGWHWSSSEYSYGYAWYVAASNGDVDWDDKRDIGVYVRCVLGFEDNGNGTAKVCGAEYQYSCDGENITGGSGSSCAGMYSACTCASGYEWKNGACKQAIVCKVGDILNSDMTCSTSKVSGKTPIGVVSYISGSKRLAINLVHTSKEWGGYGTDISGLTNYSSSPHTTDFSGKSNTSKIVSVLGSSSTSYAAGYCYNYTTAGTSKGDWYLPAQGELYATVWTNKAAVNSGLSAAGGTSVSGLHWSSSEYGYGYAWSVSATYGDVTNGYKGSYNYVRCVLAF